jgi:UDP-N-acetylglucosamine 2-epimerase (non-hydrolysing)
MSLLRVLSIFGTRPEAVKMAPVVRALNQTSGVESLVCVTAQHRQMLDQVLGLFDILPDLELNLMKPDQSLADLTGAIFTNLAPVMADLKPDWVLVQGDTTTVMAVALTAYYHHVRVGHVEAGLRTGDKWQPFPEEVNRQVAGVVADLHFAPTEWARQNLLRENVAPDKIPVTGNTVIDALKHVAEQPPTPEICELIERIGLQNVKGGGASSGETPRLVIVTAHRRENFSKPLEDICLALRELAQTYEDRIRIVYPVHLNPNV